ncbi:InlB B-repeat-containing protein [Leucobacter chromiireducens]|uniref:Repeat protein (TIGR02543 family) n=1 Tax=Leucobacter chromiireducens subsp. chromiireducens TaxID=660067 RepID=A0ABS1SN08_9MICO|nr:InlB B-repeat-containing protein [Leucobacter chromiireducens]MBL3689547.1 hypothetical protein [Leucobacter chromiireducens subsp. chromiireducens]
MGHNRESVFTTNRPRRGTRLAAVFGVVSALLVAPLVAGTAAHAAAATTVETAEELRDAFAAATTDTEIMLGASFPDELSASVKLANASGANIAVDGAGHTLLAPPSGKHFDVQAGGAGSVQLRNLALAPAEGRTNGGLQLTQNDAAEVTLSEMTISDLGATALNVGGSGSGSLRIEDVTLSGNTASSAAAFSFGRNNAGAETVMNNVSVTNNVGDGGYGYSGGAARAGAGSSGTLRIANSLFENNTFREGGSQPRGGAIALHNSNVQLVLENDLFQGNSTFSAGTPGSADGGAISVFNSSANTSGSLLVRNSSFIANEAGDDGAAIFIEGRNANSSRPFPANLTVTNSTFANNVSGDLGGSDTGGAIQASLRVDVNLSSNTFVGNTKANGRKGVDFGTHSTLDSTGFVRPIGTLTNNIFTRNDSVAGLTCSGGAGCGLPVAQQDAFMLGVFGTAAPVAAENGTTVFAGDSRGQQAAVPTVAIVPPLAADTHTASRAVADATALNADQRGVAYRAEGNQDAGSFTMDYVRFNATENGGSWAGLTPVLPGAQGSFLSDATATGGWFEVAAPGAPVPLPTTAPTPPAGTTFLGWFDSASGGTEVTTAVAAGQTVYAQFSAVTHTVTFDPANGESTFTAEVTDGDPVTQPADPDRDGFTFTGWTLDDAAYDFSAPVTSDLTLVAAWEEIPAVIHTVTFDPANGESTFTAEVTDGDPVAQPADPEREGFTFTGWTLEDAAYDFSTPVISDLTIVAGWEEIPATLYTVTFDPANGNDVFTTEVIDGDPVAQPADPQRDGFTFVEWTLDGAAYNFTAPVTADITLLAVWEEIPAVVHTVTFDPANGGDTFTAEVTDGDTVAKPADPTREGFTFVEWMLDGAAYDFTAPVTADITLLAVWEEISAVVHTVTFDPANGAAAFTAEVTDGDAVAKPADPTRDGFTFTGWTLESAAYDFAAPVTADITLVAGWEKASVPPGPGPGPTPPGPTPPTVDPATPQQPLERTGGAPIAPALGAAAVLLALGAGLIVARKRRAQPDTAADA